MTRPSIKTALAALFIFPTIVSLSGTALHGQTAGAPDKKISEEQSWALLKEHILKQSNRSFKRVINGYPFRKVEMPLEQAMLKRVANRLSRAAGRGDYDKPLVIARWGFRDVVNAMCFPGGQMVYLTGLFKVAKKRAGELAAEDTPLNKKLGKEKAIAHHYEGLIAAVVGHEMGHYVGQHFFRRYTLSAKNLNNTKVHLPLEQIRYGQEHELESDDFSLQVMARAGYDTRYVVEVLKLLKKSTARAARGKNPYLNSHPSGNTRIAAVAKKSQGKEFYDRLARLELAFASIETGADLEHSAGTMESEVKRFPNNPYLLTAAAKVYHRLWEASCTIDDLQFKPSISAMSFRDNMIQEKPRLSSGMGAGPSIPCDVEKYKKAVSYYRRALKQQADFMTQSSFAALLVYDPAKRAEAVKLGEIALKNLGKHGRVKRVYGLNNMGIVYFFTGDHHSAEQCFDQAAGSIRKFIKRTKRYGRGRHSWHKRQRLIMGFSKRNVGKLFEAYFNLGQLYYRTGHTDAAKQVWNQYLTHLDWTSDFAKHAAQQIGKDLSAYKPSPPPSIAGVSPGTSIPFLLRKWGRPSFQRSGMNRSMWRYGERGVTVMMQMGIVRMVQVQGKGAPPLSNGVYVGMSRQDVESKLGKARHARGSRVYFPKEYMVVTFDSKNMVSRILIRK